MQLASYLLQLALAILSLPLAALVTVHAELDVVVADWVRLSPFVVLHLLLLLLSVLLDC